MASPPPKLSRDLPRGATSELKTPPSPRNCKELQSSVPGTGAEAKAVFLGTPVCASSVSSCVLLVILVFVHLSRRERGQS